MTTPLTKFKSALLAAAGLLALSNGLLLVQRQTAQAQSPGVNLAQLVARLNADEATIAALKATTAPLTVSGTDLTISGVNLHIVNGAGSTEAINGLGNLIVGYNESRDYFGGALGDDARGGSHNIITGEYNNYASAGGIVGGYGNSLSGIEEFAVGALNKVSGLQSAVGGGRGSAVSADYGYAPVVAGLQGPQGIQGPKGDTGTDGKAGTNGKDGTNGINGKDGAQGIQGPAGASPFTVSGTDVTLSGYNLHIVNGMGGTETTNGLGNLILGYDEKDSRFTQDRTGSHNLVVGTGNNYLSFGGLVAGQSNLISAPYASVTGGQDNVARSGHASVSGGAGNVASGGSSSISGGQNNRATADYSSVSGGGANTASDQYASVSGGRSNTASGLHSTVTGGEGNTTRSGSASISGGHNITESSNYGWKAGSQSGSVIPVLGNFISDNPF